MRVLISRKKVEWVAHNYKIAIPLKADLVLNDISTDFKERILQSPLFWAISGERICIALDLFVYITVSVKAERTVPIIIGYTDTHNTSGTVVDRFIGQYFRRENDGRLVSEVQTKEAE